MKKAIRYLSALLLMGALAAPLAFAQDRDQDRDRDHDRNNQRVYDAQHHDYHQWNADEDRNYREWYADAHKGKQYRDYNRLNKKDQQKYWTWRHKHHDNDHDHDQH
ncbi:MAG TPA: hypothetical protein VFQ00_00925 [Terriglobales bacterium]|nr:hypothetical protein [Terriglobales bacterium]